jgi:hypothetical protein
LKGKVTETALHDLVYKIDGSLAQKKSLPWAERAFDNTSFESMDDTASDHGVCSTKNRWIDFFMIRWRSVFVDIRGVRLHIVVRHGCPQRNVLLPLLWNTVADSLLNRSGNCICVFRALSAFYSHQREIS